MGKLLIISMVALEATLIYRQLKRDGILDETKQKAKDYIANIKNNYNEGRHDD